MRAFKFLAAGIAAATVLLLGAGSIFLYGVSPQTYHDLLLGELETLSARPVEIRGGVRPVLGPWPTLIARDVTVANPSWASRVELARIGRLALRPHLLPLIAGHKRLDVALEDVDLLLETGPDDSANWAADPAAPRAVEDQGPGWVLDSVIVSTGRVGWHDPYLGADLDITFERVALDNRGGRLDAEVELTGAAGGLPLAGRGELRSTDLETFAVDVSIDAFSPARANNVPRAALPVLNVELAGRLWHVDGLPAVDLGIEIVASELDVLHRLMPGAPRLLAAPVTGSLSARLHGARGDYALQNLSIALEDGSASINARGAVSDLRGTRAVDLDLTAELTALSGLAPLIDIPVGLADVGPVNVSARAAGSGGHYRLENIDARVDDPEVGLRVRGGIDGVLSSPAGRLDAELVLSNLDQLNRLFAPDSAPVPSLGTLSASGVVLVVDGAVGVEKLVASIDDEHAQLKVTGRVPRLAARPVVELEISGRAQAGALSSALGRDVLPFELPQDAALTLSGMLTGGADGDHRVERLEVTLRTGDLSLVLRDAQGTLATDQQDFWLELQAGTLAELGRMFDGLRGLPPLGPVQARARLYADEAATVVSDLEARIGDSDVAAEVSVSVVGSEPVIRFRLRSERLDLDQLLSGADWAHTLTPGASLYPEQPLPLDALRGVAVDGAMEVARLRVAGVELPTVSLVVSLVGGRVEPFSISSGIAGGMARLAGKLTVAGERADLDAVFTLAGVELGQMVDPGGDAVLGGPMTGSMQIEASGGSIGELLRSIDGRGLIDVGPFRVAGAEVARASSALAANVSQGLSYPDAGDGTGSTEYTHYLCGVLGFGIRDGVLVSDKGIALEAKTFTIGGSGEIDLKNQRLHVVVRPRARTGMGISLASLSTGIEVKGPLGDPQVNFNVAAGVAVTYTIGLFTRGIIDRIESGSYRCERTRRRIESWRFEPEGPVDPGMRKERLSPPPRPSRDGR